MNYDIAPLWLTLKLALITPVILIFFAIPLAWWLTESQSRFRYIIQTFVNMPLVLPPSVLGFYLLVSFSPAYFLGRFLEEAFNLRLVFSFPGIVIGSVLFNIPFMVNPILSGFESLPKSLLEASHILGKSRWVTLFRVQLPNMKPALLTGVVLTFAHTIGEFGVVLMIGGKIPGIGRTASVAIYDEVESFNFAAANFYALILFGASFVILLMLFLVNKRFIRPL